MSETIKKDLHTILLINDNSGDSALIIRELSNEFSDLQMNHVRDQKSFTDALNEGSFDLVITDYKLCWTNGLDILKKIKAQWPDCPVIMSTDTDDEEIAIEAIKSGLDDYILKSPKHFMRIPIVVRLVVERTQQRQELKKTETRYRTLFEDVPVGLYRSMPDGKITDVNPTLVQMLGYPNRQLLLEKNAADIYVNSEDRKQIQKILQRDGVVHNFEKQMRRYDGTFIWAKDTARAVTDAKGQVICYEGSLEDITARKRAEVALQESENRYRRLIEFSDELIFSIDRNGIFKTAGGTRLREFGLKPEDIVGHSIETFFFKEQTSQYHERHRKVFESGKATTYEHTYEFAGVIRNDMTILYPIKDEHGKVELIGVICRDISERKQVEEKLKQSFEKLQNTIKSTISAIARIVEMRDPYTAGHQQRVTVLAIAIAREMNLPEEQIRGLHIAALIHDIGKIYVPAEILSRPSNLNESELALIKTHSKIGYDILKTIEFPWPIAKIVYQHHERLDGSGYPEGIKNGDILLEARILAVADMVEAMSSHRPYRPARGLKSTLEETKKNKGILYDPDVVDVCLELFNKKNFKFQQAKLVPLFNF
ncbi:PAS domain S-box protein [candidate division WOR-3 bacterium]|nr:PAS domain S-box protein [candidate division WOR-3 bacterium]